MAAITTSARELPLTARLRISASVLAGMRIDSVMLRGSPLLAALLPRAKAEGEDLRLRVGDLEREVAALKAVK